MSIAALSPVSSPILSTLLSQRILILDGAMGTMIQQYRKPDGSALGEADYRGARFADWPRDLKGNNDLLVLTQPQVIAGIHDAYLQAGADLVETCTFNATSVAMADYGMEALVYEINHTAAKLAKDCCAAQTARTPDKPRFVIGVLGPTNRTASISPDVNDPGFRNITFQQLVDAYQEAVHGLVEGGVDALMVETIFDTLNAKAAVFAIQQFFDEARGTPHTGDDPYPPQGVPVMISGTITDQSGRTLTGQTTEAFYNSLAHAGALSYGLNCALGPDLLRPYVAEMARISQSYVSVHANAGLPNAMGEYDLTADVMAAQVREWAESGWVNIVGGCCGTMPAHIAAIAQAVAGCAPRPLGGVGAGEEKTDRAADIDHTVSAGNKTKDVDRKTRLAGLEPLNIGKGSLFINVGERTNVTGSKAFARLILAGDYTAAVSVARQQVENGAQIIDINMDEGMLEAEPAMVRFLSLIAAEPDISRVPVMIDSSRWPVIEAGLRCVQGKGIVNSISLKEGEATFLAQAKLVRRYGAAAVVMAFDETGQADTFQRKIDICARSYRLLTERLAFPPEDIIFDPNVFAIATGIAEHARYGLDFLEASAWIRENLPHAKVSGGVSNISFSFRGNNRVREAIHAVFLYHAVQRGMTMGIVNAGALEIYEQVPDDLRVAIEDVLFAR